jgi:hypothetical protein
MAAVNSKLGRVGHKQASWDEVRAEIGNSERFPFDTSLVLLERTEYIAFVTKKDAEDHGLFNQYWTSGHLFNTEWELNWEKQGSDFLLCLLSEGALPSGWEQREFETDATTSLLLFGERVRDTDPGWREARIPQWLQYPVGKNTGRVRLIAIPYLREGMVVRMRLKKVEVQ